MITDLEIIQSTSTQEQIDMSTAHKLYQTAKDTVDNGGNVTLEGNLQTNGIYEDELNYLNTFQDLTITSTTTYARFADPVVEQCLMADHGDGTGVPVSVLPTITRLKVPGGYSNSGCFAYDNNSIQTFNELNRLTILDELQPNEFRNSSIVSINLANIKTIGAEAFKNCQSLQNVGDLSNVRYFGNYCFQSCTSLSITADSFANAETINGNAFDYGIYKGTTLTLPKIKTIGNYAFSGSPNLTTIVCGDSSHQQLTNIGERAFTNCPELTTIDLENTSLTYLYRNIFNPKNNQQGYAISKITMVKLPTTLTTYGSQNSPDPIWLSQSSPCEVYGLDNVTTIEQRICGNIINAIHLDVLETSQKSIIYSGSSYTNQGQAKQYYLPKFKYSTISSLERQGASINSSFFTYRIDNGNSRYTTFNVLYFKDLQKIQAFMFYHTRIKNLVINNSTPPAFDTSMTYTSDFQSFVGFNTWVNTMFGDIPTSSMTIYVPDAAISTYQADSNYSAYTIAGISTLTKYQTEADWVTAGRPDDCLIEEYM